MGFLEYRCIYLHQMCWNSQKSWSSYIQGQVSQPRPMDTRTDTGKHIHTEKLLKMFKINLKSLTFFAPGIDIEKEYVKMVCASYKICVFFEL